MGNKGASSGKSSGGRKPQELNKQMEEAVNIYVEKSNKILSLYPEQAEILAETISEFGNISGKVELYRSMSIEELGVSKMKSLKSDPEQIIGKTVTSQGFLSTAKTQEGTLGFGSGPSVTVQFTNAKSKGLDISKISQKKNEQEVLFNRGTKYKITQCKILRDKDGDFMNFDIRAEIL